MLIAQICAYMNAPHGRQLQEGGVTIEISTPGNEENLIAKSTDTLTKLRMVALQARGARRTRRRIICRRSVLAIWANSFCFVKSPKRRTAGVDYRA